jgi:hypothetical protein
MAAKNQHVVLHKGKWGVKSEGSERVKVFDTKQEAIDAGLEIVRKNGKELLVHGRHGQIFRSSPAPSQLDREEIRQAIRKISAQKKTSSRERKLQLQK